MHHSAGIRNSTPNGPWSIFLWTSPKDPRLDDDCFHVVPVWKISTPAPSNPETACWSSKTLEIVQYDSIRGTGC